MTKRNPTLPLWLLLAAIAAPASDEKPGTPDLTKLSLEDLMRVEVTSVTRRNQALSRSAAAIYVITSDDIRRSSATTVPELLRMVPGILVSRLAGNKWSISSRGPGGRYVANLLVLVDGRTVYTPLFSGVIWEDHEFIMEDIERIEVIRGPGAVVWGSNAVSGVINIITRSARKTQGDAATVTAGNLNQGVVQLRHGSAAGASGSYRAFGRVGRYGNLLDYAGRPVEDGYSTNMGGFRMDVDKASTRWMMEGSLQSGTIRQRDFMPSLATGQISIANDDGNVSAGHLLGRWNRTGKDGQETRIQLYYDWYDRKPFLGESRHTVDLDASRTLQLGSRHALIVGGGYRESWDSIPSTPRVDLMPPRKSVGLVNGYLQDQVQLGETTSFSVGARVEYSYLSGVSVQPAAQFLWTPTSRQSVWASVSRALRTPSRGEQGFKLLLGVIPGPAAGSPFPVSITALGQHQLGSEDLLGYEAGYRNQISKKLSIDLATYFYDDRRMRAFLPAPAPSILFVPTPHINVDMLMVNGKRARNWGGEISVNYSVADRWRLLGWYSRMGQRQEIDAGMWNGGVAQMPHDSAALRSQMDLGNRLMLDTDVYFRGQPIDGAGPQPGSVLGSIQDQTDPGHFVRLDTRLTWKISPAWEITAGGENLIDAHHLEMVPEVIVVGSQVRRSWFVRLGWHH